MQAVRPIYEWLWTDPGGTTRTTRSARRAGVLKRFAAKLGDTVTRRTVGMRMPFSLEQLMEEEEAQR